MEVTRLEESQRISFQSQNGVLVDQPDGVGEIAAASFWMIAASSPAAGERRRHRRRRVERERRGLREPIGDWRENEVEDGV